MGLTNGGEVKKLIASDGAAFDNFGISVAICEDTVIVGAYNVFQPIWRSKAYVEFCARMGFHFENPSSRQWRM
jgi:FG-GAP repeat